MIHLNSLKFSGHLAYVIVRPQSVNFLIAKAFEPSLLKFRFRIKYCLKVFTSAGTLLRFLPSILQLFILFPPETSRQTHAHQLKRSQKRSHMADK